MRYKYETIVDGDGTWHIGISLGTVYSLDYDKKIKLSNFGYCIKTGEFYFNSNLHLKGQIARYFNGKVLNDKINFELNELNIYNKDICKEAIKEYEENIIQTEIAREKVFEKVGKRFK